MKFSAGPRTSDSSYIGNGRNAETKQKMMTMDEDFHPTDHIYSLDVKRKEGGKRPVSIFVCTALNSSRVNCPTLMSSCLFVIFVIGLSVPLGNIPIRFLKCSFHICIRFSWLIAFSSCSRVAFFYSLHLLSAMPFVIQPSFLFIALTLNVFLLLLLVCVSSLCALSFWALALIGFLLLHKDAIFTLSEFFFNCKCLQWNSLALSLFGIHSDFTSMQALTKFSYLSFGVSDFRYLLKSTEFVSYIPGRCAITSIIFNSDDATQPHT